MDTIRVSVTYGPLRVGQDYKVIQRKNDWYLVKCKGKQVYVPDYLIW